MTVQRFENVVPMERPRTAKAPTVPLAEHTTWLDEDMQAQARIIEEVHTHGPKLDRIVSTGIDTLNELIDGWIPGQSYIVAGKTSGGKTSFATHTALCLAVTAEVHNLPPMMYFSLEMTPADMSTRAFSWITCIPQDRVQRAAFRRTLTDEEVQAITTAHARLTRRIRLVSTTDASTTAIRAAARDAKAKHGLSGIVVDHIGLVEAEKGQERGATREREIAFASRGLRAMAMELDVPVIVLCQLGRRADKEPEPHLSMLRESGAIENDASGAVLFIWDSNTPSEKRIIAAKRRFGPRWVECRAKFDGATGTFSNPDGYVPLIDPDSATSYTEPRSDDVDDNVEPF